DARRIGLGEECEILGQHVSGLEIRNDQDLGSAGNFGFDAFDSRCFEIDRVVESQRAINDTAADLAAIGHLAQRRRFDGGWDFWRYRLDRRQDRHPRRSNAYLIAQIDHVLDDVALGIEVRKYIDGGV